jgi:hypothetical protein
MSELHPTTRDLRALVAERHPATAQIARFFEFDHLPDGPLREASELCAELAFQVIVTTPDSPELSVGLRKLLEAKDCFVRAQLAAV